MRHAAPLFDPIVYRGATNKRRFYEELTMPRNLVVLGDAVCVFNPSYGQVHLRRQLLDVTMRRHVRIL